MSTGRECMRPPPLHVVESTPAPPDPDGGDGFPVVRAGVLFLGAWIAAIVVLGGARLALGAFR